MHIQPQCPSLLIFAECEVSFHPQDIVNILDEKADVTAAILQGNHGFMDRLGENYHALSAEQVEEMTHRFLESV